MINTVEKVYNPISSNSNMYKVTYNNNEIKFVPHRRSKHRLPSNTGMD
jgi:hypothetical protein